MNILLTRYHKTKEVIDGYLKIDGSLRLCDTAENAQHCLPAGTYRVIVAKCKQYVRKKPIVLADEGSKVSKFQGSMGCLEDSTAKRSVTGCTEGAAGLQDQKESCLEGSTFNCEHCSKIDFVSNNTTLPCHCPQITPGNGAYNRTDGAILVGTHIAQGSLKFPKEAFDNLYDRIRKSAERGHEITLTIIEKYPEPFILELSPYAMGTRILKQF